MFNGTVTIMTSRVICFHKDFYCIGTDITKVASGIEDLTEMKSIDNTQNWNSGVCLSAKKEYGKLTREQAIEMNDEYWCFPVIEAQA